MKNNPFKENSTSYYDFNVMSDLKWHCTKCELKSGQAKTWQVWRQEKWIQLDKNEKWNWFNNLLCENCKSKTVHRKLLSIEILDETKSRSWISPKIAKKVKDFYKNEEAFFLRDFSVNQLEVDHKFPQIRWNEDENFLEFIFGMNENKIGIIKLINIMKNDVLVVFGMIHINGEKN